jgi:uncharacterized protein YkwD
MKSLVFSIAILFASTAVAQNHEDSVLIRLTNQERAKLGLKPLQYSIVMDSAAEFHTRYMVSHNKIDHTEYEPQPGETQTFYGGRDRVKRFANLSNDQFSYRLSREVCAAEGMSDSLVANFKRFPIRSRDQVVQEFFKGWMNSPGHRSILMDPEVTHIAFGIGLMTDSKTSTWYYYGTGVVSQKIN